MKFLELFNPISKGNYALTDESIYSSIQNSDEMVPLYGGNKSHIVTDRRISCSAKTKSGVRIFVFDGEGIIISLDGSAGSMTYKNGERFALNHHAGYISVREDAKKKVSLEYFAIFLQNYYRSLGVSEGSKTLSLEQIYLEDIQLPTFETQLMILDRINGMSNRMTRLSILKQRYIELSQKRLDIKYKDYQAQAIPIKIILDYISGNSGLTEEFIYHQMQQDEGDKYVVLSSATEERTMMGAIAKCEINGQPLKIFENKEGLLVTRNGKAGSTRYLSEGRYTINDHAYILYVKDNCPYEVDLKWLSIQYYADFMQFSSNADNGTWNMTGFFEHTIIDIPSSEEQKHVVKLYEKIEHRIEAIQSIEKRFNQLISRQIITA